MKLNIYVLLLIFLVILMYFQPSFLGNLCSNCFGKATLVLLIVFLAIQDISLAILASVILISSMHLVSREGFKEHATSTDSKSDITKMLSKVITEQEDKKQEDKKKDETDEAETDEAETDDDEKEDNETDVNDTKQPVDKEIPDNETLDEGFKIRKGAREGFMTSSSELISLEDSKIRGKNSNIYPVSRPGTQNNNLFSGFNLF